MKARVNCGNFHIAIKHLQVYNEGNGLHGVLDAKKLLDARRGVCNVKLDSLKLVLACLAVFLFS